MFEEIASGAGNLIGAALGWDTANKNMELQKQFAKQGIRWKVADAQAAGIHPLYALGAPTMSFSPVSTGDVSSGLAQAGQDIGRAIDSTRTQPEKISAYTQALQSLQLERGALENTLLKSQIAKLNAPQPPMASGVDPYLIPGQTQSGVRLMEKPLQRTASAPGVPSQEPGAINDVGFSRTATGWAPVPSQDVKQRIEDSAIPELAWAFRNQILPTFGAEMRPPPIRLRPGFEWRYNWLKQEYQIIRSGSGSAPRPRRHSREYFGGKF